MPEHFRSLSLPILVLSDVSVSINWYKTVSSLYENSYVYSILYKVVGLNRSYSANTKPIWKRLDPPTETWESQVWYCYNYMIFIMHW